MQLQLYALEGCPHCRKAIAYLEEHGISFVYHDIEKQPPETMKKIIEVNGGKDWVVPTLEYNGKWIAGEVFDEKRFSQHLKQLKVI